MNIKIIYETQTGTTQYVAELIQTELEKAGHRAMLHSITYNGSEPNLEGVDVVIFGAPTYDDGKLEKVMLGFTQSFQGDLNNRRIAVFGLGNSNYPLFCYSADILEKWATARGGRMLLPTLKVDGFPDKVQPITAWVQQLLSVLK